MPDPMRSKRNAILQRTWSAAKVALPFAKRKKLLSAIPLLERSRGLKISGGVTKVIVTPPFKGSS